MQLSSQVESLDRNIIIVDYLDRNIIIVESPNRSSMHTDLSSDHIVLKMAYATWLNDKCNFHFLYQWDIVNSYFLQNRAIINVSTTPHQYINRSYHQRHGKSIDNPIRVWWCLVDLSIGLGICWVVIWHDTNGKNSFEYISWKFSLATNSKVSGGL